MNGIKPRELKDLKLILDRRLSFTAMKRKIDAGLKEINEDIYIFFTQHEMKDYEHGGMKFMVMPGRVTRSYDMEGLTRAVAEKIGDVDEAVSLVQRFTEVREGQPFIEARRIKSGDEAGVSLGIIKTA